jgi:outer membrane protein insertion porin family
MTTLKTTGLAEGYVFDRSTLEQVRNELERLYFSHGKYGVKVETNIEKKDHNRVNVTINIVEGQAARIKEINIVGNSKFSRSQLAKSFTLASTHLLSWVSQTDQYDKQKLNADLEALRTYYLDRGYLNFHIISTQVSITPDKQDIYITINIEEGDQFTVSGYALDGNLVVPPKELEKLITLKEGETFSRAKVAAIVKAITDRLGHEGYAFAKVNPVPELNEAEKKVKIIFYLEPGSKIYVRRVLFEGNSKTKDEVVRRELVQTEGAPVNTKSVEESRTRLNRTGYFSEVKVDMRPVAGTTDQVDLVYSLTEASSGQLGGGVGYSDADGLLFNASVSNRNFLGTGKNLDFNFNRSKAYRTYSVAYNNPYYTFDGVSRGFNLFYSETDLGKSTDIENYSTDAFGANVVYGVPISPVDRFTYGYGFQSTSLGLQKNNSPLEIQQFLAQNGNDSNEVTLAIGWVHNTLDRYVFPENGLQQSAGLTFSVPGSHLEYYRLSYNAQWYKSLGRDFVFTTGATLGYGNGYGDTGILPFYKNFFAGGTRTVRGFKENSLGPRDSLNNPFGGNFLATGTVALILPNFGLETKSVRMAWFVDGGQVYDLKLKNSLLNPEISRNPTGPRYSTGLSVTWMSPLAPLVFSLSKPLNEHDGDRVQEFSFGFATTY